jgi:hypothetical protein
MTVLFKSGTNGIGHGVFQRVKLASSGSDQQKHITTLASSGSDQQKHITTLASSGSDKKNTLAP